MTKFFLTYTIIVFSLFVRSQNLVLNCSFEIMTNLNCYYPIAAMNNWSAIDSPDGFTSVCPYNSGSGIPNNWFGHCYPINGNACAGLGTMKLPNNGREYLTQYFSTPLLAGNSYYVSFYALKSSRTRIATEKLGILFTVNAPPPPSSSGNIVGTPQIENQNGFITDTINWTKIEGSFVAQGGEQHLTIGNFYPNNLTDTLQTGTTNPYVQDAGFAYYFIDSVSIYESSTITNLNTNKKNNLLNIYPNPSSGTISIEYSECADLELVISNITGNEIIRYSLSSSKNHFSTIDTKLKPGVYFYSIRQNKNITKQNKLIIIE